MRLRQQLRLGIALVSAGLGVSLVGIVGLVAGLGETTTGAAGVTTQASSTTTSRAAESPQEFLAALAKAFRDGDTTFLYDRLHPAVIDRYGEPTCRAAVANAADPTATIEVGRVDGPADYAWTTDGQTTVVPDAVPVHVRRVSRGQTVEGVAHIARVGGTFRWFSDCTPGA